MPIKHAGPSKSQRKEATKFASKLNLIPSSDVLPQDVQRNGSSRLPLSRLFSKIRGASHEPLQDDLGPPSPSQVPMQHRRSSLGAMDAASLEASIRKEERWLKRSHSPPRGRLQRFSANDGYLSSEFSQANAKITDDQSEYCQNDLDDFDVASDDEDPKSYLLGVSTPSTLRKRKLKLSLAPVCEAEEGTGERKGSPA